MPDEWRVSWKRMAFQWMTTGGEPSRRAPPRTERRPTLLPDVYQLVKSVNNVQKWHLRPVNGCIASAGCVATAGGDDCCLGLLTLVLLLANSRRIVCGRSGSKRIPCYMTNHITFNKHIISWPKRPKRRSGTNESEVSSKLGFSHNTHWNKIDN